MAWFNRVGGDNHCVLGGAIAIYPGVFLRLKDSFQPFGIGADECLTPPLPIRFSSEVGIVDN